MASAGQKPEEKERSKIEERAKPEKMTTPKKVGKPKEKAATTEKKKAMKASIDWTVGIERVPRKKRPAQRYGIDVVMNVDDGGKAGVEQKE